jgi:hypothetical protein
MSKPKSGAKPVPAAEPETHWIGWVMRKDDAGNGYVLQRVRIPASWIGDLAVGPASPANLRPYLVQQIGRELMSDAMLNDLHAAAKVTR